MANELNDIDILRQYGNGSFRGVEFPVASMKTGITQDQAEHKYPGKNTALVEGTGRNSLVHSFSIPFRRGLASQDPAEIYPKRWREFISACADPTTGDLKHPEFGTVKAKCKSCNVSWTPDKRDGCDVEVEFIETLTSADEESVVFADVSPAAYAASAARDFDEAIADGGYTPPEEESMQPDLLSSIKGLDGLLTQASLGIANVGAQFDAVLGAIDRTVEDLNAQDNPKLQAAIDALARTFVGVVAMAEKAVAVKGREITQKTVANGGPLNIVAGAFGMGVQDFLRLNPSLASQSGVVAGTTVLVFE